MTDIGVLHQVSTNPFSLAWEIDDYFKRPQKADSYFDSPLFTFGDAIWRLRLYPNGYRKENTVGSVEVYFSKKQSFLEAHDISCTVGIKHSNDDIFCGREISENFTGCFRNYAIKIIERSRLESLKAHLVPNNILTVLVEDLVCNNKQNTHLDCIPWPLQVDKSVSTDEMFQVENSRNDHLNAEKAGIAILSENLKGLFLNEEGCDVTFKVENTEVRAHRSVLTARSAVFASMFRHEMSETITGIVKIADCTPDAFKALLLYLYSGMVENLSAGIIYDLYEASVKYDLEYLKNKCVKFMKNELSPDTLCDTIALCQKYKESELLEHATNYFTEHALDILLTVKWQQFVKEDPVTANELYIKHCRRNV